MTDDPMYSVVPVAIQFSDRRLFLPCCPSTTVVSYSEVCYAFICRCSP